ncbi:MAG: VOC family protein [Phycisphaerae bacterium]|nr:VOC family protein [Phycisphaerae bacterium]
MGRVTHFEIHASEPKVLIAFYTALFGWSFQQWGPMEYWLITTGPSSEPGINGGLMPRKGPKSKDGQSLNSYVCTAQVESVDAALKKAVALGGTVAVPKMPIPTVGWLAYIKDPDGNIVGVMTPDPKAK